MNNMMSLEYLNEVYSSDQSNASFWADNLVPVHLRRLAKQGEEIYADNLSLDRREAHYVLSQVLWHNYECANTSEAEIRLYPELPELDSGANL